jgi:hypothetical protein
VLRHPEEQVVGHLAAIVEDRHPTLTVERGHATGGHEADVALLEGGE